MRRLRFNYIRAGSIILMASIGYAVQPWHDLLDFVHRVQKGRPDELTHHRNHGL